MHKFDFTKKSGFANPRITHETRSKHSADEFLDLFTRDLTLLPTHRLYEVLIKLHK